MLIHALETRVVEVPLPRPVGTAIHQMTSIACVLTTLRSADGASGEGLVFAINGDRISAFEETIRGLSPYVVGQRATDVSKINEDIWAAFNPTGHKGITIGALSAIDVALWDLSAKSVGLPLVKMFGGMRDRVDTYASSGLWLNQSIDELVEESLRFIDDGFRAMKIRLGSADRRDDVARVAAVREAIGPDVGLYSDLNQALTPKEAIRLARMLEPFDLEWLEEPVRYDDLAGHALVRQSVDIPVASGETEYTHHGMSAYLEAGAVDVLMPDIQRMGGLTEFRKAAAIASAHHIPISSHFFTEYSLSLAGSLPNCVSVEHIDWFASVFNEPMELVDGQLVIPDRPGTGFTFRA